MSSSQDEKLKVYEQLCNSYRAIDEFRAKLLGFLPLATGTGIFLLKDIVTGETKQFLQPIGVFGIVITLGLFFYELYGIKKCDRLIKAGIRLEDSLGIAGQFKSRPREVAFVINEPFAAGVIYPAVLAAWTYLALSGSTSAPVWAIGVLIVGFAISFFFNLKLKLEGMTRESMLAYLKTHFARLLKREKKPNTGAILGKFLNVVSVGLPIESPDQEIVRELSATMNQLGLENREPSKLNWQKLSQLAERLCLVRLAKLEEPNTSAVLVKLLNVISLNSTGSPDKDSMKELEDRLNQRGKENREPSQKDWEELSRLVER